MPFFDKIKSLLSSFQPVKITLPREIHLSFFSGNSKVEVTNDNRVNISLDRLGGPAEREKVREIVNAFKDEDYLFLERESHKTITEIEQSTAANRPLLTYFKGKLLPDDYKILRLAVYIHGKFQRRENVDGLLFQAANRFGPRAVNVCHLYSSGYLESYFKPLYEQMRASPDFKPEDYHAIFGKLVMDFPLAVFVNKVKSDSDLESEIVGRLDKNRRYGIRSLNIHAIGKSNVEKIRRVIAKLEAARSLSIPYTESNGIFRAEITIASE